MISDTIAAAVVMTIILFKPFQHMVMTTVGRIFFQKCLGLGVVFGVWCLGVLMGYKDLNK